MIARKFLAAVALVCTAWTAPAADAGGCPGGPYFSVDGGLQVVGTMLSSVDLIERQLLEMHDLALKASSGNYTPLELLALDIEYQALMAGIEIVAHNTVWRELSLLDQPSTLQVCADFGGGYPIDVQLHDLQAATLGIDTSDLVVQEAAAQAVLDVETALQSLVLVEAQIKADESILLLADALEGQGT